MRAVGAEHWMDDAAAVEPLRFRRAPMMAAALCFGIGDVLARRWQATLFLLLAFLLCSLLAWWSLRHTQRVAWAPVLGLWVVAGCWCAQIQTPIDTQQDLRQYADGLSRSVHGRIERIHPLQTAPAEDGAPQQPWQMEPGAWETEHEAATQSIDLQIEAVEFITPDVAEMHPTAGGVRVTIVGATPSLHCGDEVEVPLRMRVPDTYRDPGAWSHAASLLQEGIGAQASVRGEKLHLLSSGRASWRCSLRAAQSWAAARMDALVASRANAMLPRTLRLTSQDAGMLNAMLFGERSRLTQNLRVGFERTGTFHLFVVSGLHVTLLAGGVFWLLRRMRLPEGPAVASAIALATSFALLTGFGVPVQRALWMTTAYLVARWLAREAGALNALGIAAVTVLTIDPRALFEASFQMTFLVIVAIAGIATPLSEWAFGNWHSAVRQLEIVRWDAFVPPHIAQRRLRVRMFSSLLAAVFGRYLLTAPERLIRIVLWCGEAMLFGAVMEVCMVLPMAVYFHRATLLALPANVIAIPLVIVLLSAAILMFCLSLVNSWLAMVPAAAVSIMLHAMRWLVSRLGHIAAADMRVPSPSAVALSFAVGSLLFAVFAVRVRRWRWAALLALAVVPCAVLWPAKPLLRPNVLEVTALDVGQGDSLLVVSPEGKTLLVDAGGPVGQAFTSPDRWDVGEEVVAPYLWSRRIGRLDAVLLTHGHSDHMGGMPAVLRDLHPRELWLSVLPGRAPALLSLLAEAHELGITVRWMRAGDTFAWGGLAATILAPETDYANAGTAVNNDSLVMQLAFGKASVMLEGDAESPSEREMLAEHRVLPATLLKVGHHGSITSTTPDFLAAIQPRDAIISVGRRNTFGHPRYEILDRLEHAGVKTFRTDREGAETFLLTSDGGISNASAASNPQ